MAKYRMTGAGGMFDETGHSADALIREASEHHGCFVLWQWSGRQWRKVEGFTF